MLAELTRHPRVEHMELRPFDRTEVCLLLAGELGRPPTDELVDEVHRRSGGNPFFVEELAAASTEKAELPGSVRSVLGARIDRLGPQAQELVRVMAAAGTGASHGLIVAVSDLEESALLELLREAVGEQVLVVEDDGYRFRHALLQEVAEADLLPGERARLHARYGAALAARPELHGERGGYWSALAHHWRAAGEQTHALAAAVKAGDEAAGLYAFAEAGARYGEAVELWDEVDRAEEVAGTDRVSLVVWAMRSLGRSGQWARSEELGRAELERLPPDALGPERAAVMLELSTCHSKAGNNEAALELHESILSLLPEEPTWLRGRALAALAHVLFLLGRVEEVHAPATEALDIARHIGSPTLEGAARNVLGGVTTHAGDPEGGVDQLRRSLELARSCGDLTGLSRAYANLSDALIHVRRLDDALAVAREGVDVLTRYGLGRSAAAFVRVNAAEALVHAGRWDEAADLTADLTSEGYSPSTRTFASLVDARLALRRGDPDRAAEALALARQVFAGAEEPQYVGVLLRLEAELASARGDHDAARHAIDRGVSMLSDRPGARSFLAEVLAQGVRGEADFLTDPTARTDSSTAAEARRRAALLAERAGSIAAQPGVTDDVRVKAAWAQAEQTRAAGRSDPDRWAEAQDVSRRLGQRYLIAHLGWRRAEALLERRQDRYQARTLLAEAWGIAGELGARPLLDEIEALARRARIDLAAPPDGESGSASEPPGSPFASLGLTEREEEVLALLAEGRTNGQIGSSLFISTKTASVHVSNILAKLGLTSRVQAGAVAQRLLAAETTGAA